MRIIEDVQETCGINGIHEAGAAQTQIRGKAHHHLVEVRDGDFEE